MDNSFTFESELDKSFTSLNTPDPTATGSCYEEILNGKTKWYRCTFPDCGKTFRYKSELTRHNITHSDQRPYYCTFEGCDKAFKRMDTLEIHLRSHTGTKPFACEHPGCSYRATNKSNLYYHSLKHESTKQYKCSLPGCNKTFLTKAHLEQHERALLYHLKMSNKSNPIAQPNKQVKPNPPAAFVNTQPIPVITIEPVETPTIEPILNHNSTRINESMNLLLDPVTIEGTQDDFATILEKLQKENALLKKALETHSELNSHLKKLNAFNAIQEDALSCQSIENNAFFDDQDRIFIDFLKEKEH